VRWRRPGGGEGDSQVVYVTVSLVIDDEDLSPQEDHVISDTRTAVASGPTPAASLGSLPHPVPTSLHNHDWLPKQEDFRDFLMSEKCIKMARVVGELSSTDRNHC
jgi:hypothetical protein